MRRGFQFLVTISVLAFTGSLLFSAAARADEIKLKDGSKITGTIVGFEDNSFKVKTSYGYAVVQRDQVVAISISEAGGRPEAEKKPEPVAEKPAPPAKPVKTETTVSASATPMSKGSTSGATSEAGGDMAAPEASPKPSKTASAPGSAAATPSATTVTPNAPKTTSPATATASKSAPPAGANPSGNATATAAAAPTSTTPATATVTSNTSKTSPPAIAKSAAPQPVHEEVSGNLYTNDTYGFRMYKPPGWDVIEGARTILPGALTAMGTSDQRTYLLVGLAPPGETLASNIDESEQRLREVMTSFRVTEQKRMVVSGVSSIAHRFRGSVDQHDWSGVVVFVPLGAHIYTIFGMTYAESDLVQIQENVINRTISSLQFLRN